MFVYILTLLSGTGQLTFILDSAAVRLSMCPCSRCYPLVDVLKLSSGVKSVNNLDRVRAEWPNYLRVSDTPR